MLTSIFSQHFSINSFLFKLKMESDIQFLSFFHKPGQDWQTLKFARVRQAQQDGKYWCEGCHED